MVHWLSPRPAPLSPQRAWNTIAAVDPGSVSTGIVWLNTDQELVSSAYLENRVLREQPQPWADCVIIEALQPYGNTWGFDLLHTATWIGRFLECCLPHSDVYLIPRIEVRRQVSGGRVKEVNDAAVRAYLYQRFTKGCIEGVNKHCVQAYALGVIALDLAQHYRETFRIVE